MCKQQFLRRHSVSIFALVAISIMVASLFTPLFGGPVPLRSFSGTALAQSFTTPMVAAGWHHTVGLTSYGTVVSTTGGPDVSSWTGITQVAAGQGFTVGLKSDGTVVAVGGDEFGECDVSSWTGITQVAAGSLHTVGLKSDATVVAVGDDESGQCNVGSWTGITQVAAGAYYTVGLKSDGTVVAVGDNGMGQCDVSSWTGITQVAAGGRHTVATVSPKSYASVATVGDNTYGQCNAYGWTYITQLTAGHLHTVGLESDGTVVAVGDNTYGQCNVSSWTGITQVAAGVCNTVGLESDGTAVAVGDNTFGQCNLFDWNLGITSTPMPTPTPTPPTVITSAAGNITTNSATLNGNLTDMGTSTSVTVSFQWGNTTSYGNETPAQVMAAPGAFSGNITGLNPNTTYHFRAEAIGNGTSYGNDTTFTTSTTTPSVAFSSATYSAAENAGSATITVNLSGASAQTITVNYATSDGNATAGSDYTAASCTLTFNPGDTSETFNITILDDAIFEGNVTVNLALSSPGNATLGSPNTAVLTIIDIRHQDIPLNQGWNLVSLPLIPDNTNIGVVLAGIENNIISVWSYDANSTANPWSSWVAGFGGGLTEMTDCKGYWINMRVPDTLTVSGTPSI